MSLNYWLAENPYAFSKLTFLSTDSTVHSFFCCRVSRILRNSPLYNSFISENISGGRFLITSKSRWDNGGNSEILLPSDTALQLEGQAPDGASMRE